MSPMKRENVRKQNQNQSGEKINRTKIALGGNANRFSVCISFGTTNKVQKIKSNGKFTQENTISIDIYDYI